MLTVSLNLAALLVGIVGVPTLLVVLGARWFRRAGTPLARSLSGATILVGGLALALVGRTMLRMAPGQSGIVEGGLSPDGHEYCVVQSHNGFPDGFGEPYTISLYVRDDAGNWRWHYLDHEGFPWRSARVEFDGELVTVHRDGVPFRQVELERDPATPETPERGKYMALRTLGFELTADDVAEWHRYKAGS
jgi:hypothetical protein